MEIINKTSQEQEIDLYAWYRLETALQSYFRVKLNEELPKWAIKRNFKSLEELKEIYVARIAYEYEVIKKMGFCGYFLIVADGIDFCRKNNIPVGPGRGSAAGSLCSFLLRITKVDPIKYDLLFERFLNPERYSMPDIDNDFSQLHRYRMKEYYTERYGTNKVASIGTFSRMKVRAAIKDIVKSLNLAGNINESFKLAEKISKTLEDEDADITYHTALVSSEEFRRYMEQYPIVAHHIIQCENVLRQMSMHAAGVLISAQPLDEELPLMVDKNGMVLTAYDGKTVESLGYLKLDTLGLKNLDTIADCRENIKKIRGTLPKMDVEGIDIDPKDESVSSVAKRINEDSNIVRQLASRAFKYLREKSTLGIFQCEQGVTQELLRKGETNSIEDIAAILALIRPGPRRAGSTDVYIARKRGEPISYSYEQTHQYNTSTGNYDGKELKIPIVHDLSCIESICNLTQGLPLFQEQLMKIAVLCAGFTRGESDQLRKAVGKKDANLIKKTGEMFVAGMQKGAELNPGGCSLDTAEFLWKKFILPYGSYGFNASHSISYAMISFETAWLKANFPGEFYAALLSHEADQNKINHIIAEAKASGIRFLPPNINKSTNTFTITDPTTIVYSLTCMKGIADKAAEKIVSGRPYKNMIDFIGRAGVNSNVTTALIKGGAFDDAFTEETVTRKNYFDFFEDARAKLNRQIDRLLREALLKKFNYPNLKGDEKRKASESGSFQTPASFHNSMMETDANYLAEYTLGERREIDNFKYNWSGPVTVSSKGIATAVTRESNDDRSEWLLDEHFDFEEEVYGTALSGHRLDPFSNREKNFIENANNSGLMLLNLAEDLSLYGANQEVFTFCQLTKFNNKFPYRKDPKQFTRIFEIEDRHGKGRLTVFNKTHLDILRDGPISPLSVLEKKLGHRPVAVLKCKITEYNGMRGITLDSIVEWIDEDAIKNAISLSKTNELKLASSAPKAK